MPSNSIYQFHPTFLYIKRHRKTGKLYFGKTIKNPLTYYGSGKHWLSHIEKHGKDHVETIWFCLFLTKEELVSTALLLSKQMEIVSSSIWLNLIEENGLDGCPPGLKHTETAIINMKLAQSGLRDFHKENKPANFTFKDQNHSEESKSKIAEGNRKPKSEEHCENISKGLTGKKLSTETKLKLSISRTGQKWFNNGKIEVKSKEPLEGFVRGRIKAKCTCAT